MAKQKNQYFVGRIGHVIYYELNGQYYMRSVPEKVNQQPASKVTSKHFAIASTAGGVLRRHLLPVLPFSRSKPMQNGFASAIARWLNATTTVPGQATTGVPDLQNFSFNAATSVSERWKIDMRITHDGSSLLQLHLPAFVPKDCITAPAKTRQLVCTITAATCGLQGDKAGDGFTVPLSFPYNREMIPAQTIPLPLNVSAGSLVTVAVALRYIVMLNNALTPYDRPEFMPAEVVAAMYL